MDAVATAGIVIETSKPRENKTATYLWQIQNMDDKNWAQQQLKGWICLKVRHRGKLLPCSLGWDGWLNHQLVPLVKRRSWTTSPRICTYLFPLMHIPTNGARPAHSIPAPSLPFGARVANSGPSPLPPCPRILHVAPLTAFSHPQNGQDQAPGEDIPAKTALFVCTSFAMHWEEGGSGGENLHFKHLHLFWKHLRRFQAFFCQD